MSKTNKPFSRAVEIVGSPAEMARLTGLSPSMVYQIQRGLRPVPATVCYDIEIATSGAVGRAELQPAGYKKLWPELAQSQDAS